MHQFLFDIGACVGEGFNFPAVFVFDFENVVVAAELENVADFSGFEIESGFLKRARQRLAINPAPIAAIFARTCLRNKAEPFDQTRHRAEVY